MMVRSKWYLCGFSLPSKECQSCTPLAKRSGSAHGVDPNQLIKKLASECSSLIRTHTVYTLIAFSC